MIRIIVIALVTYFLAFQSGRASGNPPTSASLPETWVLILFFQNEVTAGDGNFPSANVEIESIDAFRNETACNAAGKQIVKLLFAESDPKRPLQGPDDVANIDAVCGLRKTHVLYLCSSAQ